MGNICGGKQQANIHSTVKRNNDTIEDNQPDPSQSSSSFTMDEKDDREDPIEPNGGRETPPANTDFVVPTKQINGKIPNSKYTQVQPLISSKNESEIQPTHYTALSSIQQNDINDVKESSPNLELDEKDESQIMSKSTINREMIISSQIISQTQDEINENSQEEKIIGKLSDTIDTPPESNDVLEIGSKIKGYQNDNFILTELTKKYNERISSFKCELNITSRFVIGYRHITDKNERLKITCEHLEQYLKIHLKLNFDTLLLNSKTKYSSKEELEGWPIYIYGQDKQGHILLWDEIGSVNVKKLDLGFLGKDYSKLQLHRARIMRKIENMKSQLQIKYNCKNLYKHSMIFDLKKFSLLKHGAKDRRDICQKIISELSNMYPETVFRVYVINAPAPFRAFWAILKKFMDPITVDKTRILGKSYIKELLKDIDINMIPNKHGGNGIWKIKYGDTPNMYPINSNIGL